VRQLRPGGGQILLSEAVDAIVATAYDINADLIALGTDLESGRGPFEQPIVEQVIEQSGRAVLAVRGVAARGTTPIEKILCPVNYTPVSKQAFDRALLLASAFDASLVVVHTIEGDVSETRMEAEAVRLSQWIGDVPRSLRLTLLVDQGDAPRDIIRYTQAHDVDLLVIGARSDSFTNRTLLGRTGGILARHAPCAVLTVPSTAGPAWSSA
jgi:nucleotide-binding universal stress UspA family protein